MIIVSLSSKSVISNFDFSYSGVNILLVKPSRESNFNPTIITSDIVFSLDSFNIGNFFLSKGNIPSTLGSFFNSLSTLSSTASSR